MLIRHALMAAGAGALAMLVLAAGSLTARNDEPPDAPVKLCAVVWAVDAPRQPGEPCADHSGADTARRP